MWLIIISLASIPAIADATRLHQACAAIAANASVEAQNPRESLPAAA
jgi:hypothetical protein